MAAIQETMPSRSSSPEAEEDEFHEGTEREEEDGTKLMSYIPASPDSNMPGYANTRTGRRNSIISSGNLNLNRRGSIQTSDFVDVPLNNNSNSNYGHNSASMFQTVNEDMATAPGLSTSKDSMPRLLQPERGSLSDICDHFRHR